MKILLKGNFNGYASNTTNYTQYGDKIIIYVVTNNKNCEISLFAKFSVFLILVKQTDKMINNDSNSLSIIKDTASKILPDCTILLFGSRARKDNSNDSDYDFLVITRETIDIRKKRTLKSIMRKELARFKIPADILIQSEDEIKSKKEITGHIIKQVLREGIVL